MTVTVISTNEVSFFTFYDSSEADDALIVLSNASIVSTDNSQDAIRISHDDVKINIFGSVFGSDDGIFATLGISGGGIYIGRSGSIGAIDNGIVTFADNFTIENHGEIYGDSGIYASGDLVRIVNSGVISSNEIGTAEAGVYLQSGSGYVVINSGTISGRGHSILTNPNVSVGDVSITSSGTLFGGVSLGEGTDILKNSGLIDGNINLGANDDVFDTRLGQTMGDALGGLGEDLMLGSAFDDRFFGEENNDDLRGRDGEDYLDGGDGDDMLWGGNGDDELQGGNGADTMIGGAGNDLLVGGAGADTINGGDGDDLIQGGASDGVNNQFLRGEGGNDQIVGGETRDIANGGAGDDDVAGFGGNDFLLGGTGDDLITGGFGNDAIRGEDGIDTARYSGVSSDFDIFLDGNGTLRVNDQNSMDGNEGNDNLTGVEFLQFSDGTFAVDDLLAA
eukprot:CAMPEP_0197232974 /NCGR_PEP_ID=MMETSP1429-20130617/1158_1 /TAXON_ID=49237 /ORGANISM="Chaetoceros  sp., Strain UNC1202" /LENGTH=448 /DNA_ID=CAMNT_0042691137 /DNA_START=60 /DNA_END=1406 /DNA_ORIENTATION=+